MMAAKGVHVHSCSNGQTQYLLSANCQHLILCVVVSQLCLCTLPPFVSLSNIVPVLGTPPCMLTNITKFNPIGLRIHLRVLA